MGEGREGWCRGGREGRVQDGGGGCEGGTEGS